MKKGEFKLVIDCVENVIFIGRGDGSKWILKFEIVNILMGYFEENKDVDGVEGFLEILKKSVDNFGVDVFELLIRIYVGVGRINLVMYYCLKMENVEVNEVCKKLFDVVCVE